MSGGPGGDELPRVCRYCLDDLHRRSDEREGNWLERQYCGRSCAARHDREKKQQERRRRERLHLCLQCGVALVQRGDERPGEFKTRRYCGRACYSAWLLRNRLAFVPRQG